jgi:DNA gyrase subunit A
LIAISLENGDALGWARLTSGKDEIILVTTNGQALRFTENQVRPMGRQAAGVTGIHLKSGDRLAGMEVVEEGGDLLVVTQFGYSKRTPLKDYPSKHRATGGITTIDQKNVGIIGKIAAARVVEREDDLTIISTNGVLLRVNVKQISPSGRATRGSRLINLGKGDSVASLARITAADLQGMIDKNAKEGDNGKDGHNPPPGEGEIPVDDAPLE